MKRPVKFMDDFLGNTKKKYAANNVVLAVLGVSLIPFICFVVGIDLSFKNTEIDHHLFHGMNTFGMENYLRFSFKGTSLHILLETISGMIALFVVIFSFLHYRLTLEVATPIIGMALFYSGLLDIFHILIVNGFVETAIKDNKIISFTWFVCRLFHSFIMIFGVGIFVYKKEGLKTTREKNKFIISFLGIMGLSVSLVLWYCLKATTIPDLYLVDKIVSSPLHLIPLIFYIYAGWFIYSSFSDKYPGVFSFALLLSIIPEIMSQLHMAFGSQALFDHHFNSARLLKILTYFIPFLGFCFNYTENLFLEVKYSRRKLKRSEFQLNTIFQNANDGIIMTDSRGYINSFNHGAERLFGYSAKEIIGKRVSLLAPKNFLDQYIFYFSHFCHCKEEQFSSKGKEISGLKKDGSTIHLMLSLSEEVIDGKKVYTGIATDITELKEAHRKMRESSIELKRSNLELEKFAYIASHDLIAPLRGINTLCGFLEEDLKGHLDFKSGDKKVADNMKRIRRQTFRMEGLITGILDYSRVGRNKVAIETINIRELIEDIKLDQSISEAVVFILPRDFPLIESDKLGLTQVFSNLISNAIKYHKNPSNIVIKIDFVVIDGGFIEFKVIDNGPGIDPKFHKRIFEIFQTLQSRDEIESTGIGLSIVKKIIEQHGGAIFLNSESGLGCEFVFTWPLGPRE